MDMTMSTGRRVCPECKGNGHLRARDYTPIIPDELQPTKKD